MSLKTVIRRCCQASLETLIFKRMRKREKARILVAEDDEIVARMIKQMLGRLGYSSLVCTDPLDALTLFTNASERFDAVILDYMMPGLRGTELSTQLLRIRPDIPIILTTGHGDMLSMEQVRESGVRATLIKPVLRERLQTVLRGLLGQGKTNMAT